MPTLLEHAATLGSLSSRQGLNHLAQALHQLDHPISQIPLMSRAPLSERKPRPAAVLIPIHSQPEPSILLTVRSHRLQHHPGQIAFPGGAADQGDQGPAATALREAWEEVGLPSHQVRPLGYLDRLDTISGYRVVPVIAQIEGEYALRLDPGEVDSVFYLPLAIALDTAAYQFEEREHLGQRFQLPVLQFQQWRIWGATAIMLWRLCRLWREPRSLGLAQA